MRHTVDAIEVLRMKYVVMLLTLMIAPIARQVTAIDADTVYQHGRIYTGDPTAPWAEALAVRGDRIVAVGADADITTRVRAARTVDLRGRLVIPGINDAHDHPGMTPFGVEAKTRTPPMADPDLADVSTAVREAAAGAPAGTWIQLVVGFKAMADPAGTRAAIATAAAHPVFIKSWWGHGVILNDLALARLGISDASIDPPGGHYQRDAAGHITGKLEEYAGWQVMMRLMSETGLAATVPAFRAYANQRLAEGVTTVQAMSGYLEPALFVRTIATAEAPIRVRLIRFAMPTTADPTGSAAWRGVNGSGIPRLTVSGIKWVLDGTPLPVDQLAWNTTEYAGRPGWFGRLNFDQRFIESEIQRAFGDHEPLLLHTVGDATSRFVLQTMARIAPAASWRSHRVRLEHSPLSGDDLRQAVAMGVVMAQPRFDSAPLRAMLDAGLTVAYGSDEGSFAPFVALRQMVDPARRGGALTRTEAVAVLTSAGAFAEFSERDKGRLVVGMLADFAVLSQNVFEVPLAAIPATRSVLTVVGGRTAWQAPDA